ncbi:trafficking protein particle complex II-specific subunit 130-like protein [Iris pallida]|uniref:Trafficking protein particle complex II-specific subunit 130-like protein n=1 Tax=Iris pallida TaxID=29817 RepID=A0AAX6I4V9_IRIPA|nr:trafficking protein particle complex II-specific subunit 130-like protein [Iris pallida]
MLQMKCLKRRRQMILQANPREKHFNIERKPLPLEPSLLLREANRRRASLSVGNVSEILDNNLNFTDGSDLDGPSRFPPSNKVNAGIMSRTFSQPTNFESSLSLDRPMKLSEIYVAASHALKRTISDQDLLNSLSSLLEFEQKYMELTKGAADNYHRSWWKRHGVVLDGEIGALSFKHGNFDLAAKSYEKVCALYASEGWQDLLAEVLPNLAECQKILNDEAGYLSSCVRLLSLDNGLFLTKERQAFQAEVVRLAHSEMKHPVPLDVSSLITFSGNTGPPLELCDGDPGTLSVTVWSGFPDDIPLESLSLTLMATYNVDEGVKAIKSLDAPILKPGKNVITLSLPPQKPGSYVLGVLTGQIGQLIFRSHSFSKGGPQDNDDFMSYEKPTRPVLKVSKPRPLVDIVAATSSALLMNELQWVGLIVRPMNYSLKGAILQVDTGPGLTIEESHMIDIEDYTKATVRHDGDSKVIREDTSTEVSEQILLENGKLTLPDWASDITTVLWLPVCAIENRLARGTSAVHPQRQSVVDGMRTIALKLEFGAFHNQIFERHTAD